MIAVSFFSSPEFYVVAVFVAAAVIGLAAMPGQKGEVRTFLYAGMLDYDGIPSEPCITARVDDSGHLHIHRLGLSGISTDGAYSIAVKVSGFDVTIEERLTGGADKAHAIIDCLGLERYHIRYRSEATGRSAAFSLRIAPGNTIDRLLS